MPIPALGAGRPSGSVLAVPQDQCWLSLRIRAAGALVPPRVDGTEPAPLCCLPEGLLPSYTFSLWLFKNSLFICFFFSAAPPFLQCTYEIRRCFVIIIYFIFTVNLL